MKSVFAAVFFLLMNIAIGFHSHHFVRGRRPLVREQYMMSTTDTLKRKLNGINLSLVGMMGSGKTTIGRELSQALQYQYVDTDDLFEQKAAMPIAQYFQLFGEQRFRDAETNVLQEIFDDGKSVVIATGGGVALKNENWNILRRGIVVFIDPPVSDILNRLSQFPEEMQKRPLLRNSPNPLEKLQRLRIERISKYLEADIHVAISGSSSITECAHLIANRTIAFIDSYPLRWKQILQYQSQQQEK